MPAPTLVILSQQGLERRIPIEQNLVIGRDPANEVPIDDNYLSRRHCVFASQAGRVVVRDLGSYNGTYVNGQKIHEECYVLPGDVLRLGRSRVYVDFDDQDAESSLRIYSPDLQPKNGVQPVSKVKEPELPEAYRRASRDVPRPADDPDPLESSYGPRTRTQHRRVSPDDKTPVPFSDVEESAIARLSGSGSKHQRNAPGFGGSASRAGERSGERGGDRAGERDGLRVLAQITRVLGNLPDVHELCDYALSKILAVIPAERGLIMRLDAKSRGLYPECARSAVPGREHGDALRLGISHTIARKVIRERVSVMVEDAVLDPRFMHASSVQDMQLRSILAAPLWLGERVLGLIYLDHMMHAYAFSDADRDLLVASANIIALGLQQTPR